MTNNTAIEFLFFSYFGEDICEIENGEDNSYNDDKILNTAIKRAYRDAASHVLQLRFREKLTDKEKEKIVVAYKEFASTVFLNDLKSKINESKINEKKIDEDWVEKLAEKLIEIYNPSTKADPQEPYKLKSDDIKKQFILPDLPDFERTEKNFTFGVAQKWINMTIKNIYVMDTIIKLHSKKSIPCLEKVCKLVNGELIDIPVDDYIIKAACGLECNVPLRGKNDENKWSYEGVGINYNKKLAWSNWELEKNGENYYRNFQNNLKEKLKHNEKYKELPDNLDKENRLWIDVATGRKYDKPKRNNKK